ncbi:MAG: HD domain-containing protein, partial [Patescibacteria group bacterium]
NIYHMKLVLPKEAKEIIKTLKSAGFEAYAVGGSVRDLLLGKASNNWDFTTNATPEEIIKLFPETFYDNKFGTVGIPVEIDGIKEIYEITTFRTEQNYTDKRHPDIVRWGKSLKEDLERRDFTIGAIAFDGKKLFDPYSGEEDLKNKIIRAVRDPHERFAEDALRMMRAIRIATELGFVIEEKTFSAIARNAHQIDEISEERVRDELIKILKSKHPADGILLLHNAKILARILPELETAYGVEQAKHHIYDVFKHSLEALRFCPSSDWLVRFAALIHDIGKPVVAKGAGEERTFYNHEVVGANMAKIIASRLHFSKFDREKLYTLARWHMFSADEVQTNAAIRRFIRRVGSEFLGDIFDVRIGDRLGSGCTKAESWRLKKYRARTINVQKHIPTPADLKIDGHDVMRILNLNPGPKVGEVLKNLFERVMEGTLLNDREILLQEVEKESALLSC